MGILNLTPDSFSDGGKYNEPALALAHVGRMMREGAVIIDIGGYSSRPFAPDISVDEELSRIYEITRMIINQYPELIISVDTFRAEVAREMLALGVHMINDISAGTGDSAMLPLIAEQKVPYIIMHMQGNPQTMQEKPEYDDVVEEVWNYLVGRIREIRAAGIVDIIADPGFGFGKTILHNYQLLGDINRFVMLDIPLLAGVSRKSMIYKLLNSSPNEVLPVSTMLHGMLMERGVNILRVHDVKAAAEAARVYQYMRKNGII